MVHFHSAQDENDDTVLRDAHKETVWVWGLPLNPLTHWETLDEMESILRRREPSFVITANLNYAMLTAETPELQSVNQLASLILADGMPLVWASRLGRKSLPERVTGADLVFSLCERSAKKGYRIYIFGGPAEQGDFVRKELQKRFSGIQIVGTDHPPFREWSPEEESQMLTKISQAEPDILFVALTQPKGELWILRHYQDLGIPLCLQIGASFDFITGRFKRAPKWMQKMGLEWFYRFLQEPRRLGTRYAKNIWFIWKVTLGSLFQRKRKMG
jgi:N-acetylglucosaminyldiphosphoundecaprenol N-acetyl-beta-D-mannosaminyltransferase